MNDFNVNATTKRKSLLTIEERDQINKLNAKNEYGISQPSLQNLIKKHRAARNRNDLHTMEAIEYRLTDINFHSECGLIHKGLYEDALKMTDNW